jgi:hypothetical protein
MNADGAGQNPVVVMGYVLRRESYPAVCRWADRNIESLWYQLRRIMRHNGINDPAAAISMLEAWFAAHPGENPETYY